VTAAVSVLALAFMGDAAQKEPIQFLKARLGKYKHSRCRGNFFHCF
jgi:hypothetical protein